MLCMYTYGKRSKGLEWVMSYLNGKWFMEIQNDFDVPQGSVLGTPAIYNIY